MKVQLPLAATVLLPLGFAHLFAVIENGEDSSEKVKFTGLALELNTVKFAVADVPIGILPKSSDPGETLSGEPGCGGGAIVPVPLRVMLLTMLGAPFASGMLI